MSAMTPRRSCIIHDAFALRSGERVRLDCEGVGKCDIAILAAPVPPLPLPTREKTDDGEATTQMAIIGACMVDGEWQWMHLAPSTKELLGDLLIDNGLDDGKWHGLLLDRREAEGRR